MTALEHTKQNLIYFLNQALNDQVTHLELADWCYTWCQSYWNDEINETEGLRTAEDIDAQWELYLINSYDTSELGTLDLSKEKMPKEWLYRWLSALE